MKECLLPTVGKYYQAEEQKEEVKCQFLLSTDIKNDKVYNLKKVLFSILNNTFFMFKCYIKI